MIIINNIAVIIIVLWALWCWFSPIVNDGIIGKVMLLLLALAVMGVLSDPGPRAETLLNVSVASLVIRHWWMRTYFPRVRDAILRRLRCSSCPDKQE